MTRIKTHICPRHIEDRSPDVDFANSLRLARRVEFEQADLKKKQKNNVSERVCLLR